MPEVKALRPGLLRNPLLGIAPALALAVAGFYESLPSLGWLGVLLGLLAIRLAQVAARDGTYQKAFSGCIFPSLILIVGATWIVIAAARLVAMIARGSAGGWFYGGLALLLVAALHLGSERLYARLILAFMGKKAGEAPPAREPETKTENGAAGELGFREYGPMSDLPPDDAGDRLANRVLHPGSLLFYRGLLLALFVGALFTVALSYYQAQQAGLAELQEQQDELLTPGDLPAARQREFFFFVLWQAPSILLAFAVAAVVSYRRGRVGWFTALVCIGVANIWKLVFAGLIHTSGIAIAGPGVRPLLAVPPVISLAIALAFFLAARRRADGGIRGGAAPAPRLLLLRVFGIFGNTQSLFRLVAGRWQAAGPVLTIADAGYARLEFSRGRFLVLLAAFAPLVFILSFVGFDAHAAASFLRFYGPVFVAIYLPILMAYFFYRSAGMRNRFARNAGAIHQRIAFESGGEGLFSSRYQQGTAYCYDDTWKGALRELAAWSDVILMDLRGFSPLRQGCLYELGFLVDRFPLKRAVFLMDETTDRELLKKALTERWSRSDPASPNRLGGGPPTVTCYRASNKLLQDLPRLIALLARAAAGVPDGNRSSGTSARAGQADGYVRWIQLGLPAAAVLIALGVALQLVMTGGKIDLALARGGMRAYCGISLAWFGVILLLLVTRMRSMLALHGNLRHMFQGFPWPQVFWMVTVAWLALHFLLLKYIGL